MTMSTLIPGSLAGTLPPGRNSAGRPDAAPPGGFDDAYRDIAGSPSNRAPPPDDAPGADDGAHRQVRGPGRWAQALSGQGTGTGDGRSADDRDGRPDAAGAAAPDKGATGRHGPVGSASAGSRKPAPPASGDRMDGADGGSDGKGEKASKDKAVAVALTVQPRIDLPQRSGRKAEAAEAATAASGSPPEAGPANHGSGKAKAPAADAAAVQRSSPLASAKVVTDAGGTPSALADFDTRLADAEGRARTSRNDGTHSDGKAQPEGKDGFQLLRAGVRPLAAPGRQSAGPSSSGSKGDAQSNSDKVRHLLTRTMDRAGGFADSGKNGRSEDRRAAADAIGPSVRVGGPVAQAGPGALASGGAAPQASNFATVANGMAARADWSAALTAAATGTPGGSPAAANVKAMTVQLNPAHLGTVTATLQVSGDRLVIQLQVQTAEAYRQLSTGNDAILDKLKGHGYAVEAITVQHVVAGRADAAQPQQPQHAAFAASQGNAGGLARGGQPMAGQGQGQHPGGQQPYPEDPAAGGSDAHGTADGGLRRADGVYV